MNQKVLGSVFVLAVALGMISVAVRSPQTTPAEAPAKSLAKAPGPVQNVTGLEALHMKNVPHMDRAMSSYRVYEYGIERGMDFRGAQYNARVSETEVRFGTTEGSLVLGAPKIEQGSKVATSDAPAFVHPAFGVARLERGPVTEEYVFENRRMEQLFHIPSPLGTGALRISVPLQTTFPSVIEQRGPGSGKFDAVEFRDGGLAVLNTAGEVKFTCTSAIAWDATRKNSIALTPRHADGAIVLEVPESFMAKAAYPIVVDPWFTTGPSNVNGGLSNSAATSDRPAMRNNIVAWADAGSGTWTVLAKLWTGTGFNELAGSASGAFATGGNAENPSVISDGVNAAIAWEAESGVARAIFVKQFVPGAGNGGVGTWVELPSSTATGTFNSASGLGISQNLASNRRPSIGLMRAVVPGTVTVDPSTGVTNSTPATHPVVPVVAWESGNIYCSAYYPGAPAIPPIGLTPGLPAVPAGWYQLNIAGGGTNVNNSFNGGITIGGGTNVQLVVDSSNQVTLAFEGVVGTNIEVVASRWTPTGAPAEFQIVASSSSQFDMRPPSNFRGVAGAGLFDNVSNTGTPSQYPSMCVDPIGSGLTIAWQETEAVPGPTPATSSQIYVRRSTGATGAPWNALGISASAGGLSRTGLSYDGAGQTPPVAGNAGRPSVSVGGGYVGVAWADTSNSRSSIYVRRCLVGGTIWEQIGFQGSAFPPRLPLILPPTVPEPSPINGISKSPNYAYQPQIQMDGDGSPLVVWADGSGSNFDIESAFFYPQGPGVAVNIGTNAVDFQIDVRQTFTDPTLLGGAIDIPVAGFANGSGLWISSHAFSESITPVPTSMWLEIEIRPTGTPLQLQATHQVLFNTPDFPPTTIPPAPPVSLASTFIDGLPNGNYHFAARTRDNFQRVSPWFEQTDIGGVSFRINNAASGSGPSNTAPVVASSGSHSKGACGLLGLEAAALLGLLRLLRRKRAK